jgi:hypothetical protein
MLQPPDWDVGWNAAQHGAHPHPNPSPAGAGEGLSVIREHPRESVA